MNRKNDPRTILILSMLIALLLIVLAAAFFVLRPTLMRFSMDFYFPIFKLVNVTENTAAEKALLLKDKTELARAVLLLGRQNERLTADNAALRQLQTENAHLRILAGLKPPQDFKTVMAEVLLRDPATWLESFVIDKGTENGIRPGNLVIATTHAKNGDGNLAAVVGRVERASKHSSSVATLLNPNCFIGAFLTESGTYGVLSGTGSGNTKLAKLTCLPPDVKYGVGELVLTSRYSKSFPADIFLGSIAANHDGSPAVRADRSGLSAEADLKPAIDLAQVRFVAVLTRVTDESDEEADNP